MEKSIIKTLFIAVSILFSSSSFGQKTINDLSVDDYPQYVIITTENTKLLGGINIIIDSKKSEYEDKLYTLEEVLQSRKKMRIRNQTDLLNAMWEFGYEFVNAFNANAGTIGGQAGDDVELLGSESKFRVNLVFKKAKQ